ncbi:SDR family oxidoreductase [Luteibacter aegosomatis]|uniref:SDR family NAD(P)-dependent oxidoreductase n=1 Tax=Luteibacter aegosomatis TaxID=2911537 RepID=UPI001FF83BD1|nr:SDR family oxidoreductase [Luteibacter aegosomatis]UPG85811.1 SDR family oxidoreductase [Luteibacter aegosomatis]
MSSNRRRVALVTGATSGIGKAIAESLAAEGIHLIVTGRQALPLRALAQGLRDFDVDVYPIAIDLADPSGAQELFVQTVARGLEIDFLVNNAGVGVFGTFEETGLADELAMLSLNTRAPTVLCKLFLPQLARRKGRILNIASVAAFQPGPYMAVYYATKAYLLSFSEALAAEWEGSGVSVTTFCPGPTCSGFQARAAMEHSRLVQGKRLADADEVGRAAVHAMMVGGRVVVHGTGNRFNAVAAKWLPRRWITRAVLKMSAPVAKFGASA